VPGWASVPIVYLTDLSDAVVPPSSVLERADAVAAALWVASSAVLLLAVVGGLLRLARKARAWVPARVSDALVLLSDDFGPAVLGVRAPRVVLPRWTLRMEPERLRLVVLHEEEHRRAGDVAVLLAGLTAVVLAPWNAALWWQLRRLRSAVELDCDARVLRRGAPATIYGRLLLEIGITEPGLPVPVATLSRPPSLLERRLTMILCGEKRGSVGRSALALAVAALLVVVACETPVPTAVRPSGAMAEKEQAPVVSSADVVLQEMFEKVQKRDVEPLYFLDGELVGDMKGILPYKIERVEVVKGAAAETIYGPEASVGVIRVITTDAPVDVREAPAAGGSIVLRRAPVIAKLRPVAEPRILVDGKPFEGDAGSIDPSTIERIEVVKADRDGEPSTIHITLKKVGG
jgi:beta-lactamase regulating signal transducer with metallopeptidase domain